MFEALSKAARYSDVLRIRHFVRDGGLRRTTPKGDFLLKRKALWLPEEKIRSAAYRWRIDCDCRRDCVSLTLEPAWPLVVR